MKSPLSKLILNQNAKTVPYAEHTTVKAKPSKIMFKKFIADYKKRERAYSQSPSSMLHKKGNFDWNNFDAFKNDRASRQ